MEEIARVDLGTVDGFAVRASLHPDIDTVPWEFDCYTSADMAAWKADKWHYVTILVTASLQGHVLGTDSLSGVHHGVLGDGSVMDALKDEQLGKGDMVETAVKFARANAVALRAAIDEVV